MQWTIVLFGYMVLVTIDGNTQVQHDIVAADVLSHA